MTPKQVWAIRAMQRRREKAALLRSASAARMAWASQEDWERITSELKD